MKIPGLRRFKPYPAYKFFLDWLFERFLKNSAGLKPGRPIAEACQLDRRVVSAEQFFGELLAGTSPKQGGRDRPAGVAESS